MAKDRAQAAVILWKQAITKVFMNQNSGRPRQINYGFHLRNWSSLFIQDRRQCWCFPLDDCLYKCNGDECFSYEKHFARRYYYSQPVTSISTCVPISISMRADSHIIESRVSSFIVSPANNLLSNFENASIWTSLSDGIDTTVEDPTILLD